MSKQNHLRALPGTQIDAQRRERAMQLAFVNVTSALPCRPEPRHRFDNAARKLDDPSRSRPWADFAEPLLDAAIAAARIGGTTAQETEERIVEAVITLLDYCTAPFQKSEPGVVSYLAVAREVPEAIDWLARARMTPTPEVIRRATEESAEACGALRLHIGGLSRPRTMRSRMGTPSDAA